MFLNQEYEEHDDYEEYKEDRRLLHRFPEEIFS